MGVISLKIFPACKNMFVCCPALRSRSQKPVKRYKKMLVEIFLKSHDGSSNERKIAKLCEYAAKNPFRIPKIAKCLEERCYKELRSGNVQLVIVITEVYNKLLCMCKDQMVYFAENLLNVAILLLDNSKQDVIHIIGCQTLTKFIDSQVNGTYTYRIENMVQKVCKLACGVEEGHEMSCLRASALQCLSAMVWFMTEFPPHIFIGFDEIVNATLDSYERDTHCVGEARHNWVEVVRPRPEAKDLSLLTREEVEMPKVWAQICIQRMVLLTKESPTMRLVLDPIFVYFDTRQQWVPNGLAFTVLSDMTYFMGNPQLILAAAVRHLDKINVSHDPQLKSHVIRTVTALALQIRSGDIFTDIGFVSNLCKHLRNSLEATVESVGEHELNLNISLQRSIEDCLLETAKRTADPRALFDMMAITLEKLPSSGIADRVTVGSLIILAHKFSLAHVPSNSQVFPEGLLVQLLKVMSHPDVEVRVKGHEIFSTLLIPGSNSLRFDASNHIRRWLEKLHKEKDGNELEKHGFISLSECMKKDNAEEEGKQTWAQKNYPNFQNISSIIDMTVGSSSSSEVEPSIMKFSEFQISQLISELWKQANLSDNLPSNIEAIARSFCLTLISFRVENPEHSLVLSFFQLPLSLWKKSLDNNNGTLSPANQRSLLILSAAMLMFAAKIFQIPDMDLPLKPLLDSDVDPYLGISVEYQVYVKPQAEVKQYCSVKDNQAAASQLIKLGSELSESDKTMVEMLVQSLSGIIEMAVDDISMQLSEPFMPDDAYIFRHQTFDMNPTLIIQHSKESSFDGVFSEDDVVRESAVPGVEQLMERVSELAEQMDGTSPSTSPLPFSTVVAQCEALATSREKLFNILFQATPSDATNSIEAESLVLKIPQTCLL